jgi:acyl carrier protein
LVPEARGVEFDDGLLEEVGMGSIEQEVIALVSEAANVKEVTRDSTWEELGLDSLDVTEILMKAEEKFGVSIPDGEAANWKTVGDVIDYLERRGRQGAA